MKDIKDKKEVLSFTDVRLTIDEIKSITDSIQAGTVTDDQLRQLIDCSHNVTVKNNRDT